MKSMRDPHVFYIVFYTCGAGKLNPARWKGSGAEAGGDPLPDPVMPPDATQLAESEVDHVAIAVRSFDELLPVLERLSGTRATAPERVESQGVEVCFVGSVELIRPLGPDNGVARFIERRGPGLHHIAYRVPDVAGAMDRMAREGYRFTSDGPMVGRGGHRIGFVHPKSAGGVLVELVEADQPRSRRPSSVGR